jgi:hypothetical protein
MNRARVEELKRAERVAIERVFSAKNATPYDASKYHRALVEWKSARLALRSLGIAIPRDPEGIDPGVTLRQPLPAKDPTDG